MSKFKDKMPIFLLGFLFGLTFAGGFFILKLDDYFKELSIYKNFSETFSSIGKNEDKEVSENNLDAKSLTKQKVLKPDIKSAELNVSEKNNGNTPNDSVKSVTSNLDSLALIGSISNDEIVVKKDELINSVVVSVNYLEDQTKNSYKDSLLARVSGVDNKVQPKMMNVEFWKSPLNFKGYKMSTYRLTLFGLPFSENLKLYKFNDNIYLKIDSKYYQFVYTNDFDGYKLITDEALIARFK